jgi:hypothetical protein
MIEIAEGIKLRLSAEYSVKIKDLMQGRGYHDLTLESCNAFLMVLAGKQSIH